MTSTNDRPRRGRPWRATRLAVGLAVAATALLAACVPPDGGTGTTTTTTEPVDPNAVSGVQLTWAYSQYAQYGVFGAWSQVASGPNVAVNVTDGQSVTGLPAEAAVAYTQGQFDGGTGSIDPVTGEGTITWDTGDWVLNAYNGMYGAPDETLRDPVLDIEADGSGTLSFEAYIPAGLDILGNPAPAAGPTRIAIATFDGLDELTATGLKATPDFAGRSYTDSFGQTSQDCGGIGGSWPAEWIDFVPASVQAHYFTTSCSGLNLRKPPVPFSVSWATAPAGIVRQPTLSSTTIVAGDRLHGLGARVGITGTPTPSVQWQRSTDGVTWTDVAGATGTQLRTPMGPIDAGASFRAVVAGTLTSDVIGPTTATTTPTEFQGVQPLAQTVGRGDRATFVALINGAPIPDVQWEVSRDAGTTWTPVAETMRTVGSGVINTQYTIQATTDADDGLLARVRASNGLGDPVEHVSETMSLTVLFEAPVFDLQPIDRTAFAGQAVQLVVASDSLPAPTYQWQTSADDGATWTNWSSPTSNGVGATLSLAAADVTPAIDGDRFRVQATSAAGTATSDAAELSVLPVTGGKQIVVVPSTPIDPTQPVTLDIIGAGFAPPTEITSSMRLVITDTTRWQPGQNGNTVGNLGNFNYSASGLRNTGGFLYRQVTVPAGSFGALDYGVATFASLVTERFYDTWTPLTIATPGG
jgi:hypothetical protein